MTAIRLLAPSLLASALFVSACAADSPDEPRSFEDLEASSARTIDGEQRYVVEWDIPLTLEQLRSYYDESLKGSAAGGSQARSIVGRVNGNDDVWANGAQKNLTYCVSTNFGSQQARVIGEMSQATTAWSAVGNVRFVYKAGENSNCMSANPNVVIAVQAANLYPADGMSFPPSQGKGALYLDLATADAALQLYPNRTSVGILRHELGHILGLRHEHVRNPLQPCPEEGDYAVLTPYDRNSVMHYPQCGGFSATTYAITGYDATGIHELYGPMPARPQTIVTSTVCSQGSPTFAMSWFRIRGQSVGWYEAQIKRGSADWANLPATGGGTTYVGSSGRVDALRVRACNDSGCGDYSDPASFQRVCF